MKKSGENIKSAINSRLNPCFKAFWQAIFTSKVRVNTNLQSPDIKEPTIQFSVDTDLKYEDLKDGESAK